MSKYGASDFSVFLVDGYNLLASQTDTVTAVTENITEQTNPFGVTSEQHTPINLSRGTMTANGGFYDTDTDAIHTAIGQVVGRLRIVCMAMFGNVIGRPFIGFEGAYSQKYEVQAVRDGLTKANVTYVVTGDVDEGVIVQDLATFTADWDTKTGGANATDAPVDNLAGTSDGGAAYLQCSAYSGFSGVDMKIMHSPDDITYAALVTFTNLTAIGKERKTVSGTVDRYLSSQGDVTGTGSVTVFSGFARY